jgi:hypothetical protein
MKNNKGFGKFEVLTVIVVLMGIGAFLAYQFLGGTSAKKVGTMRDSASSLARTVVVHKGDFHNDSIVFLEEVINEQYMKDIKNPAGKGNCSRSESYVELEEHGNYVTLTCGDFIIHHADIDNLKNAKIYQLGELSEKKTNDTDIAFDYYNCKTNGNKVFKEDYLEYYFVYKVNQKFGTKYYFSSNVNKSCTVEKKTYYRTATEVK